MSFLYIFIYLNSRNSKIFKSANYSNFLCSAQQMEPANEQNALKELTFGVKNIEQEIIEQIVGDQQDHRQVSHEEKELNVSQSISQQLEGEQVIEQKKQAKGNRLHQKSYSAKQFRQKHHQYKKEYKDYYEQYQKIKEHYNDKQQNGQFDQDQYQEYQVELDRYNLDRSNYRQFIPCQRFTAQLIERKPKKIPKKVEEKKKKEEEVIISLRHNIEFEKYFQECKYEFCGKICPGGNNIEMICVEKQCHSSAQHCLKPECNLCKNNHKNCSIKFTYEMLKGILQRNLVRQKKAMQIVYQTHTNIVNEIKKNMQKVVKLICMQGVNQSLINTLQQRHIIYKHISFKGKQVLKAFDMLSNESVNNAQRQSRMYEKMKQDEKEILLKLEEESHLLFGPYSAFSQGVLNSNLLSNKNDIKFVLEQLNYPRSMKLLYRASQNQFSISKFHQICDDEENTFTIAKTEYGKFIGGFTPLGWNTKYGRDRSNKTFLLAISLKERIQHIKTGQCAICCDPMLGPSFGGLFDTKDFQIFISRGLLYCRTNFPNTYNWKKFFKPSQESRKFLTGVEDGDECRIMDYEVFKVYH